MSVKTGFRRFVALFLSFAIVLSTFAELLPGSLVFAADEGAEMHVIVKHWHVDQNGETSTSTDANFIFRSGRLEHKFDDHGSYKYDDPIEPGDEDKYAFNVHPNSSETFAGFAVSAGNDCVTLHSDAETPYLTVKYDPNVHLVKVHVFYSAKPKLVPGTEMQVGTDDDQIGEYEDTKTQEWGALDSELQGKIIAALGDDGVIDPSKLDDKDLIKLYNTSEGLHTDKTATPVYDGDANDAGTTSEDTEKAGTRVFDINLEAWYNDQATAKVGLILDASGSMAFISEGLEPMSIWYDRYDKVYRCNGEIIEGLSYGQLPENVYLTPEQVNKILDTNLTDNSKLSYSDYAYYIYDTRDFTQEFVPLAYWGGKEFTNKVDPIGYYTFNNSLNEGVKGGSASYIKHA